jgi:membrane protein implicated in regulation of membrane protease activity
MTWPDIYLLCFAIGALWALLALLLGGFHLGHSASPHSLHGPTIDGPSVHGASAHGHAGHAHLFGHPLSQGDLAKAVANDVSRIAGMINPSCAAVFLAWFGGVGYLLTRHSGLGFWINLIVAVAVGCAGAFILTAFLRFLESREQPLNPADYDMVGVLGRVSSAIRPDGVGEIIYVRDGARKPLSARSDDAQPIARGEEVIVTRYEKGIAYVRTWDAMNQSARVAKPNSLQRETEHVE